MQLHGIQLGLTWPRALAVLGLASIGGAVGASLMWVATGQLGLSGTFIGFSLTAIGWFISARLSERAQTRLFQHNVINTARLDLTRQIREEQEWIGKLLQLGFLYRGALINRKKQELDIVMRYGVWLHELYNLSKCEATIVTLEGRLNTEDGDYSALLEDLRVHIQNSALSKIMGQEVALRTPQDPKVPIMVIQPDGLLDIIQEGKSWPVMTEEHATLLNRDSVYWPI